MVRTPFPGLPALSSEPRRGFILHGGPLVVIHCMRSSRVAAQLGELVGCSWLSQTGPAALPATDPQRQKSGFGTPHRTARAFSRTTLGLISTGAHRLSCTEWEHSDRCCAAGRGMGFLQLLSKRPCGRACSSSKAAENGVSASPPRPARAFFPSPPGVHPAWGPIGCYVVYMGNLR